MNYEQKYKEALERCRKLYNEAKANDYTSDIDDYETIFPELKESEDEFTIPFGAYDSELIEETYYIPEGMEAVIEGNKVVIKKKESEDERIRKEIIEFLIYTNKYGSNEKCESWLAWLEKQGDKDKPTYSTCSKDVQLTQEEYDKRRVSDEATIKEVEAYKKGLEDAQKIFEKQGESYTKKDVDDAYLEGMVCAKNELEKQGEQKPTDKAEPKFHEGDWVVYKNDICQIVKREEGCNKLVTVFGIEKELVNERNLSTARLWTIQDAKDGDVLEFGDHGRIVVGIVSYVNKTTGKVDVSCLLEGDKFKVGVFYNLDTVKPHPATKEQRDLLFTKMHEAGYEWDAEKKELKIELKKPDVYEYELERIVDKLNEVIGKLGDIHQVLSKLCVFPYRDYTPPQEPWYKTHGVEKVPPVTCTQNVSTTPDNGSLIAGKEEQ